MTVGQVDRLIKASDVLFLLLIAFGFYAINDWSISRNYPALSWASFGLACSWVFARYVFFGTLIPFVKPTNRLNPEDEINDEKASSETPEPIDEDHDDSAEKAPTWKYITAWLIASVLGNLISHLGAIVIAKEIRPRGNEWMAWAFASDVIVVSVVFITIYSLFSSLNMKRVMPWIYTLGFLGVCTTIGQTALQMDRLGSNQPLFLFASVTFASYLVSVLTIRYYFSMKGRL